MSHSTTNEPPNTAETPGRDHAEKTRDLHVKGVPEPIWMRARCNATNSGMTFKDYMIALLENSEPIASQTTS